MGGSGIITYAYGAAEYATLALALGRSLQRFSPAIPRALVTDSKDELLRRFFDPILPVCRTWGSDVSQKLHIDEYSPFTATLFIDCDSLVVRDVEPAMRHLAASRACAIGSKCFAAEDSIAEADLDKVRRTLGIQQIPRFNGGVYYIDKNAESAKVIARARELLRDYRRYGFHDFRADGPADELLMGAAMSELGVPLLDDCGSIMRTPIGLIGPLLVDVVRGVARFNKAGMECSPAIVHFAGEWRGHPTYARERHKLKMMSGHYPLANANARLWGLTFDLRMACGANVRAIWRSLPRQLRLALLAVKTRLSSLWKLLG